MVEVQVSIPSIVEQDEFEILMRFHWNIIVGK